MVDIEQRRVRALEEQPAPLSDPVVEQVRRVLDRVGEPLAVRAHFLSQLGRVEPLCLAGQLAEERVVDPACEPDLLPQHVRAEHVAHAHSSRPPRLVGVRRPDAAPGRADLAEIAGAFERTAVDLSRFLEQFLTQRVLGLVIRHHHVRTVGDHQPLARDAPLAKTVDLFDQLARVDHDAVADDTQLAVVEDARRHQMDREPLAVDHERVPRVGAAVVSDHRVMLGREQIDDLALALVAPLKPHNCRARLVTRSDHAIS